MVGLAPLGPPYYYSYLPVSSYGYRRRSRQSPAASRQFAERMEVPARHFLPVDRHFRHPQAEALGQEEEFQVEEIACLLHRREQAAAGSGAEELEAALRVQRRDPQQPAGGQRKEPSRQCPIPGPPAPDGGVSQQPRADGHFGAQGDRRRQAGVLRDRRGAVGIGKQQLLPAAANIPVRTAEPLPWFSACRNRQSCGHWPAMPWMTVAVSSRLPSSTTITS